MNLATTKADETAETQSDQLTRAEMTDILNEHGVGRLLIVLRDAKYDVNDAIAAINEHQESFSSRAKRVLNAVIDTVVPR